MSDEGEDMRNKKDDRTAQNIWLRYIFAYLFLNFHFNESLKLIFQFHLILNLLSPGGGQPVPPEDVLDLDFEPSPRRHFQVTAKVLFVKLVYIIPLSWQSTLANMTMSVASCSSSMIIFVRFTVLCVPSCYGFGDTHLCTLFTTLLLALWQ